MRLNEIDTRLAEIKELLKTDEEHDIDALTEEVRSLKDEKKTILDNAIEIRNHEDRVANDETLEVINSIEFTEGEQRKMETKTYGIETIEYKNVWLNKMRGAPLSEIEERAFTGAGAVVPESTAEMIVEKLVDAVPLLNEIELLRAKGNVKFAVQSAAPGATLKAGGSAVDEATTTLVEVALGSYTLSSLVRIGADTASMAINAFESWLINKLVEQLAYKIEYYMIKGSGESQPKGIDAITYVDGTNAVDWASTALGVVDLDEAIGVLPAAYDRNSKFLMSKKTFYNSVIGLVDTNNLPVIAREAGGFVLRGFPVLFSDQVDTGDIFFGDFKRGMVGNLSNEVQVEKDRNLAYNAYDYLGWCSFDCKPSGVNCIVKIASDIA